MKHVKTISSPRMALVAEDSRRGPIKKLLAELEEFIGEEKENNGEV